MKSINYNMGGKEDVKSVISIDSVDICLLQNELPPKLFHILF
jgi:hypothetical protein